MTSRPRLPRVTLALVIFASAVMLGAFAAPAEARVSAKAKKAAKVQAKAGDKHFDAGRFDEAIEAYKIAYGLAEDARMLRRIGEAYDKKADVSQAIYYYESFIAATRDAVARAEVEVRVDELVSSGATDPTPVPTPVPEPVPVPVAPAPPPPAPTPIAAPPAPPVAPAPAGEPARARPGRGKRIAGIVLLGAGLVMVGAGAYYAKVASDSADELSHLFEEGGTYSDHHAELYEDGDSAATRSIVLLAAGGGAMVAGAVLYYLGATERGHETVVGALPTRHGLTASVTCRF